MTPEQTNGLVLVTLGAGLLLEPPRTIFFVIIAVPNITASGSITSTPADSAFVTSPNLYSRSALACE